MKKNTILLTMTAVLVLFQNCSPRVDRADVEPPDAKKIQEELVMHGDTRIDNYYYMNQRDNPEVISYLEAENEYLEKMMKHTESLQEGLFEELKGRIKQEDKSAPYYENGYYYYHRYEEGGEYPIYCRKKGSMDAEEEIILDVPEMAENYTFYNISTYDVSPNNNLVAFTVDTLGRRQYQVKIKNMETGDITDTGIEDCGGNVVWANDNKNLFYTSLHPETLRYESVYKYNADTEEDPEEVYYEEDETFYHVSISKTKDNNYLLISSNSRLSNEVHILDADNPEGEFEVFQPRTDDLRYRILHDNDRFFILTNWDAQNFRLMETGVQNTSKENWTNVIPHREDVLLENIDVFDEHLVIQERAEGLRNLRIINKITKEEHYLDFPEEAYTASIGRNPNMDTNILRYNYTSMTTPHSVYDYNMETGEQELIKQQEVMGEFEPDDYETRRYNVTARDGTEVPLTIVFREGLEEDGNNPTKLYGYGSYGSSLNPRFSSNYLSLLDRGFIIAYAHVRGGQDLGREWYEDGKLLNKKNTFYDFIDCAEFLVDNDYTSPDKLFARGGSAGGLLVGAVANMRPELFDGIIARVPFVDIVTTMLDESIPLTTAEYDEWGNPNKEEYYEYMLSYSPYDNVTEQDYPNLLVTSGLHDSQVQYWEPTKWVAKLRDYNTSDNVILLHTNMEAGHGGSPGRIERLRELAMEYAFLIDLASINKE